LTRLVDDLLDVSRITRGQIELHLESVDLVEVIHSAAGMVEASAEQAGVAFEVDAVPTPVWVEGDRDRLTQVAHNLLHNAFKYSEPGGRVRLALDTQDGVARFEVSDQGAGIDPAFLPQVFEPFSQAPQASDRGQGGLGMGLTLVKFLVEAHGGSVEAHSEGVGRGTQFVLKIPLVVPPAPQPDAVPGPSGARSEVEQAPLRVLVVEDHEDSAGALRALLEIWGHHCVVARDGGEALVVASENEPHLVLLDVGLPVLDGLEVVRRLRLDPRFSHGRCMIVALTGYGQETDRTRGIEAGFDQYLAKPIDPAQLELLIASVSSSGRANES
jgi:CheY-like chemotaxis protein/two-component sensor histidine kinase